MAATTKNAFVVAPQWIGDAVMSEPLMRALSKRGEHLSVVALPWVAPVYRAMSGVGEVIEAPFQHGGLQWRERRELAQSLIGRFERRTTERRFFPGYVLVEMVMDDDTWHLIKHTSKVTGFVGGAKNRPVPISEEDVQKIVSQMQEGSDKPRHKVEFMVGELVRVKEGPFTDFNGSVEEVNYEKNKVRVSVTIFGRATPVELEFSQVEKT